MDIKITQNLGRLHQLAQTAQNPKILIEEMRIVSTEAFKIQEDVMRRIDKAETIETDIDKVRQLFEMREIVWDTINQITLREQEVKEHTESREAFEKHKKEQKKHMHDSCCCAHHTENNHECCGHHHNHECCGNHDEETHECCSHHKCGCH